MVENTEQYPDWTRRVLRIEALDLSEIADALNDGFVRTTDALLHCKGRVVVTGMGKLGRVGRRVTAMMTSTGTSAFFVHPAEATYDDLGMIMDNGVVAAISNSGGNDEITVIMPALKCKNVILIDIAARPTFTLACRIDIHITTTVSRETCPFGLTPIASTTVVMMPGDTLTVVLLRVHAFTSGGFTLSHPVDSLSKCLLLWVADTMHGDDALSAVISDTLLKEAIVYMNEKGLDMLAITNEAGRLKGMLTDGDLRCLFQQRNNFAGLATDDIMHMSPRTVTADKLVTEALKHMQTNHIDGLLVTEADGTLTGALNIHDLLMTRIV